MFLVSHHSALPRKIIFQRFPQYSSHLNIDYWVLGTAVYQTWKPIFLFFFFFFAEIKPFCYLCLNTSEQPQILVNSFSADSRQANQSLCYNNKHPLLLVMSKGSAGPEQWVSRAPRPRWITASWAYTHTGQTVKCLRKGGQSVRMLSFLSWRITYMQNGTCKDMVPHKFTQYTHVSNTWIWRLNIASWFSPLGNLFFFF